MGELWERLENESDIDFESFKKYRDQKAPRRLYSVAIGRPLAEINKLSVGYRWVERVRAYDAHFDGILLAEQEALMKQKAAEITAEHMAMLKQARALALRELDKYLADATDNDNPNLKTLRPHELIRLLEIAIKYDRLIRGESTENVSTSEDLSGLSLDDLRQLQLIRRKMREAKEQAHVDPKPAIN